MKKNSIQLYTDGENNIKDKMISVMKPMFIDWYKKL